MTKIRWGVLGVAGIAVKKVIPAMQHGRYCEIAAIASRDLAKAQAAALNLRISKAYGSYEALLADPGIDAIYNPLPNHLHVPWSIKAAEAGKHVLCEKPVALTMDEARTLIAARDRAGVKIGEAFMIATHPQWMYALDVIRSGAIGPIRAIQVVFSYTNVDPANVRNQAGIGGGGLMDIGCYGIKASRMIFGSEPKRVIGLIERDPLFQTDRLASAMLDFGHGQAVFTVSTQMVPYQSVQILGTKGRIAMDIPFNAIPGDQMTVRVDDGSKLGGASESIRRVVACDQYAEQGDAFSEAILGKRPHVPVPLEDAACNMAVIDAIFKSAESGTWQAPAAL